MSDMNNDLISRSELRKVFEEDMKCGGVKINEFDKGYDLGIKTAIEMLDNAPTVAVNCKDCDGYEAGYSAGLKDAERPQGKWIIQPHSMIMKCSLCGHKENAKDVGTINPDKHFCYFCGADMCKGGAK